MPSNLVLSSSVITPQAEVVAAGKAASVPSDELTVNELLVAVADKLVVTFSTTVTTPVLPLTLVTESVGVANNV